jgi:tRNA pseudouridine38-40 synthase
MPTYRLLVEYDGSRFAGWQVQAAGRTVQGTLLEALRVALGERELDLQGAGRTDAGVHALGQVASLRCPTRLRPDDLLFRLDRLLPQDLAVLRIDAAPRGFHARHDAIARAYRYQVATRRSAFGKRFTWWVAEPLDVAAMGEAALHFVGRRDFRRLVKRASEAESTFVEVESCDVVAADGMVLLRMVASHFLWNQVRRMVAILVEVGRGRVAAEQIPLLLSGAVPVPAVAAPAAGLFLEAVRYPGGSGKLPALEPVGVPRHRADAFEW